MKDKIIEDYKNTISRLQQECTEKTNLIIKLINKNNRLKEELNQVQLLLEGKNTQYNTLLENCENYKINIKVLKFGANVLASERDRRVRENTRYRKALEEIKGEITALHYITIPFHRGITHELADMVQEYKNKILDIINKAKGEE